MRQKRSKSRLGREGETGKKRGRGNCNQGIVYEKEKKQNKFSIKEKKQDYDSLEKTGLLKQIKPYTIDESYIIFRQEVISSISCMKQPT